MHYELWFERHVAGFYILRNFHSVMFGFLLWYTHTDGEMVMLMIKRRCSDDKVAVRKASIQTITSLAKLRQKGIQEKVLWKADDVKLCSIIVD